MTKKDINKDPTQFLQDLLGYLKQPKELDPKDVEKLPLNDYDFLNVSPYYIRELLENNEKIIRLFGVIAINADRTGLDMHTKDRCLQINWYRVIVPAEGSSWTVPIIGENSFNGESKVKIAIDLIYK
jgi:hypothetical protein